MQPRLALDYVTEDVLGLLMSCLTSQGLGLHVAANFCLSS